VYLPTIAFVLKASPLKLQALGYLLLYNIMFIVPLIVIFVLALMGTTSSQFSAFLKKHLGLIKIFMAVLFFSLGIFLIWRG
jgi:cytochrome c biogenesis protein CcdA